MYRAMAVQLRILMCDRQPLITRVFPLLGLSRLAEIQDVEPGDLELFPGHAVRLAFSAPDHYMLRLARMPLEVTEYENGLQVADLDVIAEDTIHLQDWIKQEILQYPLRVNVRDVVRSVADKGGGAHVDDQVNHVLSRLSRTGPAGLGVHKLLMVGLARLIHMLGVGYLYNAEVRGCDAVEIEHLGDIDPEHSIVKAAARVPDELVGGRQQKYRSVVLKRIA